MEQTLWVGGDADTTACMTGALAGAYWGIPARMAAWALQALPADMQGVVLAFESRFPAALRLAPSDGTEGPGRAERRP